MFTPILSMRQGSHLPTHCPHESSLSENLARGIQARDTSTQGEQALTNCLRAKEGAFLAIALTLIALTLEISPLPDAFKLVILLLIPIAGTIAARFTGLIPLWTQLTRDALPLPLAAVWAVTGTLLLLIGLGLKSRCFRLIALIILVASLGHLMVIDLIKLDPLPRILSFMTLGLGLLGLGFVYNRFQDRLKQIL